MSPPHGPDVAARFAAWCELREREREWTGEMFMAMSDICEALSTELSEVLGVRMHVSYEPASLEPLVVRRTPAEWCELTGIRILDPDGWRGVHADRTWDEPITRAEFIIRASHCTIADWPKPLADERRQCQPGDPVDTCEQDRAAHCPVHRTFR